jgi:hypothetical protein
MNRLIPIIPGTAKRGRCKHCGRPFVWITVASQPGRKAHWEPFDAEPVVVRRERNEETRVTVDWVSNEGSHRYTCPKREQAAAPAKARARARDASATGQGRMF